MGTDAFTVRSDSKKVKQLDKLASQLDRSRNYLVNQAIDQLLEVHRACSDSWRRIPWASGIPMTNEAAVHCDLRYAPLTDDFSGS